MKRKDYRKGFSLIELLVAIVVLAILGAITITAGTSAQQRARVTSAMTVFDDYKSAFNTALMDHPGLVNAREEAWMALDDAGNPDNGVTYTTKKAYDRLVTFMNRSLADNLKLTWNAEGYYESAGEDPWGGKYVLLEYPGSDAATYWDFTQPTNQATLRVSIWCTGPDSDIVLPDESTNCVTIRKFSVGLTLINQAGNLSFETQGASDGEKPFTDALIQIKK